MDRRIPGLALLALGVVLSVVGAFSHDWLAVHGGGQGLAIGLRAVEVCAGGRCQSVALRDQPVDTLFSMAGNITYFAAILAGLLGVAIGALTITRRRVTGAVSPTRLAIAFDAAVVAGALLFLATRPDGLTALEVGTAPLLAIGGAALAAAGAVLLALEERQADAAAVVEARAIVPAARPGATTPPAAAAPDPSAPGCPRCRAPMTWQTDHGRWFCTACNAAPRG